MSASWTVCVIDIKTGSGVQIEGMKPGSTEIVMDYSKTGSTPTTADARLQRRLDLNK